MSASGSKTIPTLTLTGFEGRMAMLAAYNAMFEGIELLGADEDGMGDNGGAAAAGGHLVPFVRDAVVQRLRQM
ncbi:hypothetical protein HaLaN_04086 [Haematococcus lacustris]|uniref:Uncharacterized protein n=1 Tax=Haematococcus lacustris TaxID=44745 RepID=A0A699YG36_HAELA|nr:hypothetical protein HaLaN_04086 [Haematococcus lacustris]